MLGFTAVFLCPCFGGITVAQLALALGWSLLFLVANYLGVKGYSQYLGISITRAAQLWFGTLLVGVVWLAMLGGGTMVWRAPASPQLWMHLARLLAAVPLGVMLYMKWVLGITNTQERALGMAGVQAWLKGSNLLLALILSAANAGTLLYSFTQTLALTVLALIAYPVLNTLFHFASRDPQNRRESDPARSRILGLLEKGQINAEECAVLLSALDKAHRSEEANRAEPPFLVEPAKLLLVAGLLVGFGFFIAWILR